MMKVRKDFASLLIALALIGTATHVHAAGFLKSFAKTSYTRVRGEPMVHAEPKILQGKICEQFFSRLLSTQEYCRLIFTL